MHLEVKNLSFSYGEKQVLYGIDFQVKEGEFLSILGPNGVGKSTLFRCVLGLLHSYEGQVLLDGEDVKTLSIREMAKRIAYIPQKSSPAFNYSVYDIVLMGSTSSLGAFSVPGSKEKERTMWALDKIGIAHLASRCFHRLSGGEQQLVMLARALVQNAPVLMLDEPTANLDFGNKLQVLQHVKELTAEGYTVIQTTHDPELSYLFSDRILALHGGRILIDGTPQEVIEKEVLQKLYGIDVQIVSLLEDRSRVCLPTNIIGGSV